jgi:hypothetical protein
MPRNDDTFILEEFILIDESLHKLLLTIADKRLGRQNLSFGQFTSSEQKLWNLFETADIYKCLTGEINMAQEFCFNWIIGAPGYQVVINPPRDYKKRLFPSLLLNVIYRTHENYNLIIKSKEIIYKR